MYMARNTVAQTVVMGIMAYELNKNSGVCFCACWLQLSVNIRFHKYTVAGRQLAIWAHPPTLSTRRPPYFRGPLTISLYVCYSALFTEMLI